MHMRIVFFFRRPFLHARKSKRVCSLEYPSINSFLFLEYLFIGYFYYTLFVF